MQEYELKASLGRKYALEQYDWDKLALKLNEKLSSIFEN